MGIKVDVIVGGACDFVGTEAVRYQGPSGYMGEAELLEQLSRGCRFVDQLEGSASWHAVNALSALAFRPPKEASRSSPSVVPQAANAAKRSEAPSMQ